MHQMYGIIKDREDDGVEEGGMKVYQRAYSYSNSWKYDEFDLSSSFVSGRSVS